MTRTRLSCDHFLFFDFRSLTFDSLRTPIAALFCDTLSLLYTHFANSFRRTVPRDFPAGHPFTYYFEDQSHFYLVNHTLFLSHSLLIKQESKRQKQKLQNNSHKTKLTTTFTIHFYDT